MQGESVIGAMFKPISSLESIGGVAKSLQLLEHIDKIATLESILTSIVVKMDFYDIVCIVINGMKSIERALAPNVSLRCGPHIINPKFHSLTSLI
jgi:hypothetical protein